MRETPRSPDPHNVAGMALSAKGVALAAEDGPTDEVQETVVELTEIAQRVRQGHRGAA